MGLWRDIFLGKTPVQTVTSFQADLDAQFAIDQDAIDPAVFGLTSYSDPVAPAARIDRRSAMQVPAVKRSRDLIAGSLGGLPLSLVGPDGARVNSRLFEQPEGNVPRSVTMTRTVEDLLFEGIAWWRVTEFGWHNYPVKAKRLEPRTVTVNNDGVYVDGKKVPDNQLIRFDSPNDALLIAGARAIRTCLLLDAASQRYAEGAPPLDYFTPTEGADPAEDSEIVEILDAWKAARQTRSTGYVPAALKYNIGGWNPEQLQLAEARQHAVLEIARVAGVDPEELGVSTTSRTYQNQQDRRKNFVDFTLGGYRQAVEDRLTMGDVTPRGYTARFNLSEFMRSDDKTRMEIAATGKEKGVLSTSEARAYYDPSSPVTAPADVPQEPAVAASETPSALTFDVNAPTTFDAPTGTVFEVDVEKRTIRGLAVPYGVVGEKAGHRFTFSKGVIDTSEPRRVKLWVNHDKTQAVGVAFELEDTDEGLVAAFKVARGPEGDKALTMAEDGVWDGLSIGPSANARYVLKDEVFHAAHIPLTEISLTPAPVFAGARVRSVAFDANQEGNTMPCDKCGKVHAQGVVECQTQFTQEGGAADFSAVTEAITKGFEGLTLPQRETVSAGSPLEINEPSPYRFDGIEGAHSFSEDLRSYNSSPEARQRLETFMEDAFTTFAVTGANTQTLNPTQNRPDLFVPNLTFTRPLWDLVTTGAVTDKTPFTVPKFASAAGLVGDHTEGVEPTPGSFTATSQTVTPSPVSGKVEIVREVWDQGGSPQADQIIWGEMLNGYFEAIEAKIATLLASVGTAEINLGGAVDDALVEAVQNVLIDLQYVRGGNRFSALALDGMLFKALVNAADTSGRKLLPVLGAQNAQGQVSGAFDRVQVGNLTGRAAWALGAAVDSQSYLFVPSSVYAWASAPKKFVFEYRVAAIDLAIWGYSAQAVLRESDVKPIDYTTADA